MRDLVAAKTKTYVIGLTYFFKWNLYTQRMRGNRRLWIYIFYKFINWEDIKKNSRQRGIFGFCDEYITKKLEKNRLLFFVKMVTSDIFLSEGISKKSFSAWELMKRTFRIHKTSWMEKILDQLLGYGFFSWGKKLKIIKL